MGKGSWPAMMYVAVVGILLIFVLAVTTALAIVLGVDPSGTSAQGPAPADLRAAVEGTWQLEEWHVDGQVLFPLERLDAPGRLEPVPLVRIHFRDPPARPGHPQLQSHVPRRQSHRQHELRIEPDRFPRDGEPIGWLRFVSALQLEPGLQLTLGESRWGEPPLCEAERVCELPRRRAGQEADSLSEQKRPLVPRGDVETRTSLMVQRRCARRANGFSVKGTATLSYLLHSRLFTFIRG